MRAIIVLAALVLLLSLAGWVTFSDGPDRSSINIETEKAQEDTRQTLEKTEDAIESGRQKFDDTFSRDEQVDGEDQDAARETTPSDTEFENGPLGAP
jgi:hypothetical protein